MGKLDNTLIIYISGDNGVARKVTRGNPKRDDASLTVSKSLSRNK